MRFLAINANDAARYPADSSDAMKRFVADQSGRSPTFTTSRRRLPARSTPRSPPTSSCSTREQRLRYRGAPDADHGDPSQIAGYLRDALDAILDGGEPANAETRAARLLGEVEAGWRSKLDVWIGLGSSRRGAAASGSIYCHRAQGPQQPTRV